MREFNFFVYLMASRWNGTLYCGVTNDLLRRVVEHREGTAEGFTCRYGVSRLVWFEQHSDINEAILREKRIKKWNREWKVSLIEAGNRDWRDLAVDLGLEPLPGVIPAKAGIQLGHGAAVQKNGSPPTRG
ncbi:GIY-YIG nuclease family protein [Tabrizicola sp.]|uniref:GIY-YIG nuclease family protein n=1 Tax=Tabrizicola sp. TaxID=2005166 RepID=UPI001A622088|nr:GIY-YIG nuclease family protein [Tabrizicola sp.]MBL9075225.1 GIY-YIG nuclease family protein [Tabrizicola sp.]